MITAAVTWIDGFSQLGYCMSHCSLITQKIELICFQDFGRWSRPLEKHLPFQKQMISDFEITMDAFLVPLRNTRSAPIQTVHVLVNCLYSILLA